MKIAIFGNSELGKKQLEHFYRHNYDKIIALDGGWNHSQKYSIKIDYVIGDFDSIVDRQSLIDTTAIKMEEQDTNDLEKAFYHILEKKYKYSRIYIYACLGRGLDYSFCNFSIAFKYLRTFKEIYFIDEYGIYNCIVEPKNYSFEKSREVSLLSWGEVKNISTDNLKYELCEQTFCSPPLNGLSNMMLGTEFRISQLRGKLIVHIRF